MVFVVFYDFRIVLTLWYLLFFYDFRIVLTLWYLLFSIVSCFNSNFRRMQTLWPLLLHYYSFRICSMKTLTHLDVTKCIYIMHITEIIWKDNQCLPDPQFHKSGNKMTSWNVTQIKSWHGSWDMLSICWKKSFFMTLFLKVSKNDKW